MNTMPKQTECKVYQIPSQNRDNNPDVKPLIRKSRNLQARVIDDIAKSGSALAFRDRETINEFILGLLLKGDIHKATMFVFNINTGFRNGDNQSFRVKDLIKPNGEIKDYVTLGEDKTDKFRTVWLNDTVKKMLKYTIQEKKLKPDNYIFRGDGNKRSYIDHFVYVDYYTYENGKKSGAVTTYDQYDENGGSRDVYDVVTVDLQKGGNKYNPDGTLKEVAPMLVGSVTRWLKGICKEYDVIGKYSSHTFRQTYAYFISQGWEDNRFALAACADFGHSDYRITLAHYMGIDPEELRQHQLELNLGKEAVDLFIDG